MSQPGSIGSAMPADESSTLRRIADLERQMRELGPSIADSFNSTVASLVTFGSIGKSTTAFTIPTSWGSVASDQIIVPAGMTRAAVLGIVSIGAWNGSASGQYIYIRASINGSPGASMPDFAGASSYASVGASAIRTLEGLTPGSSISVAVQTEAAGGWGANGSNIANIDVIAMFRR